MCLSSDWPLLQFGTANWEAATIKDRGLDASNGMKLEFVSYAGGDATMLRGDAVDVTTGDWLEVGRASGELPSLVPYHNATGAIMAPCESGAASVEDPEGRRIGVAGGSLDESWLRFQGPAKGQCGYDIATETEPVYGAPPLLAEQLRQGELDAALIYRQINARAET